MKRILFGLMLVSSISSLASEGLQLGSFNGESGTVFKKKCSLKVELVEKESPRFGKYKEYAIQAKDKKEIINFTASLDSAQIAIESGELGTANGSDTSGMTLTAILDGAGKATSYKVVEHFKVFGFTKKKTVISCNNLE